MKYGPKYYAVYLAKTDQLIVSGNSEQCRQKLGMSSLDSFYSMVSRARSGQNRKYEVYIEDWEEHIRETK